jgi:uncharacterized membrane protein
MDVEDVMDRRRIKQQARAVLSANYWQVMFLSYIPGIIVGILGITFIGSIIGAPLIIGGMYGLWQLYNQRSTSINDIGRGYQQPYLIRNVIQLLLSYVFILLWSLLLIVPGIIKAYSYALVPFLLADPDVQEEDVITLSRRMMEGHKWQLFILQLSFIGWVILGVLTLNILNIFYTVPYSQLAVAGFYQGRKESFQPSINQG